MSLKAPDTDNWFNKYNNNNKNHNTHVKTNKAKYNENANKFENILVKFSFFSHVNGKFNIKYIVYVGST